MEKYLHKQNPPSIRESIQYMLDLAPARSGEVLVFKSRSKKRDGGGTTTPILQASDEQKQPPGTYSQSLSKTLSKLLRGKIILAKRRIRAKIKKQNHAK